MPLKDILNGYLRLPRGFFGIPEPEEGDPDVGVLGIPYDMTSSYLPGCRFGPDAIRRATDSERSHSFPSILGQSVVRDSKPLSQTITLEDIGDLEVMGRQPESAFYDISEAVTKLATSSSHLLFLGGDHFITYPILNGLTKGRKGKYGLIYLDSHADFYEDMGGYSLSHATTMRRIIEVGIIEKQNVLAYDLRSTVPDQWQELFDGNTVIPDQDGFLESIKSLSERIDYIYLSIDLDVLRPELVPGVAHPESGGLDIEQLFRIIRTCFFTRKVTACDIVELNPQNDKTGLSSITCRDILKEILAGVSHQKHF